MITRKLITSLSFAFFALIVFFALFDDLFVLPKQKVTFNKNADGFAAKLKDLPVGEYHFSMGKVYGRCSVRLENAELYKNFVIGSGSITSSTIEKTFWNDGTSSEISISCHGPTHFGVWYVHRPIVVSSKYAFFVSFSRYFFTILLPLFGSTLLMFVIIIVSGLQLNSLSTDLNVRLFLLMGFITFLYCSSLTQIPMFFMPLKEAYRLHYILKTFYSFTVVLIFLNGRKVLFINFIYILAFSLLFFITFFSIENLRVVYTYYLLLFNFCYLFAALYLFKTRSFSTNDYLLQNTSLIFGLLQLIDYFTFKFNKGMFFSFYLNPYLSLILIIFCFNSIHGTLRIEKIVNGILNNVDLQNSADILMLNLSKQLKKATGFHRVSCYVDDYVFGRVNQKMVQYHQLYIEGYGSKDMSEEQTITSNCGKGNKMVQTIQNHSIYIEENLKNGSCSCIPVGDLGVINLSDLPGGDSLHVRESCLIIERLFPLINSIGRKLNMFGDKGGFSLMKLRSKRSEKFWTSDRVGSIFVDIEGYSSVQRTYNQDDINYRTKFANFCDRNYFPALVRYVSNLAVPERFIGDEALFIVTDETIEIDKTLSVQEAVILAIEMIFSFQYGSGKKLCKEAGFPEISFKMGVSFGKAAITLDELGFRTSGDSVNIGKRLLQAASDGMANISDTLLEYVPKEKFIVTNLSSFIVKKNYFKGANIKLKLTNIKSE